MKIWHNPRCSKSREGLAYLKDLNLNFEIFEYMKDEIDPEELAEIIESSDQPLDDFIRKYETTYKELGLQDKELTVKEFAELAAKYPKLLQRPIVMHNGKAVVARPTNKIDEIL